MAAPLSQRKFRLELEFTVSIDEVGEQHLTSDQPPQVLPYLQQLQKALLADDRLLIQQIQMRLSCLLQAYADDLGSQNPILPLQQADATLSQDPLAEPLDPDLDFAQITYPLRHSCLNAELIRSELLRETPRKDEKPIWEPVWNDLSLQSPLGKWLHAKRQRATWLASPRKPSEHCFLVRSLSSLNGQIQMEAACTCGLSFVGSGVDEGEALQSAWAAYDQHLHAFKIGLDPVECSETSPQKN